jgi:hypothetical protein
MQRKSWFTQRTLLLGAALMLCFGTVQLASARPAARTVKKGKMVYVCSCMKTKSCPCMTMAAKEGKCACGAGSPEMKAVPRKSAWAGENRKSLE